MYIDMRRYVDGTIHIFVFLFVVVLAGCTNAEINFDDFARQAKNKSPTITLSCAAAVVQDAAFSCSPSVSDPDGDPITWSFDSSHSCAWMSIDGSTGQLSGTPNDDQVGTCTVAVKANDGKTDSVDSFVLSVTNVAPNITMGGGQSAVEDGGVQNIFSGDDVSSSEEGFGSYTIYDAGASAPVCSSVGTLSLNSMDGSLSFTPQANFSGTCYSGLRFDDGNGAHADKPFAISVTPVDDAPAINQSCPTIIAQDASYSCTVSLTDADGGGAPNYSLDPSTTCAWASMSGPTISGTPNDDQVGSCNLVINADNGVAAAPVTVTVSITNVTPTLNISGPPAFPEDSPPAQLRTDAEVQADEEGFGIYSVVAASASDCSAHGSVSIGSLNGAISFTPDLNYNGLCKIKVKFDDGNSGFAYSEFDVAVNSVNDAPSPIDISSCSSSGYVYEPYSCVPTATDVDGPSLTWSLDAGSCSGASINGSTGRIDFLPSQIGNCDLKIRVSDGTLSSTATKTVGVTLPPFNAVGAAANLSHILPVPSSYMIYVVGNFTSWNSQPVTHIVRLKPSGDRDMTFNPPALNGPVYDVLVDPLSNKIYLAGSFTNVGANASAKYLIRLDGATGALDNSFLPAPNALVTSLALNGSILYLGGTFTQVLGTTRSYLAAIDLSATPALKSFAPSFNTTVWCMKVVGTTLIVGGNFTTVSGNSRSRLAQFDLTAGTLTAWNPGAGNEVHKMAVLGDTLVISGPFMFDFGGGNTRNYLAGISISGGALITAWDPNPTRAGSPAPVYNVLQSNGLIYVGGNFDTIDSSNQPYVASYDNTLRLDIFRPVVNGSVQTVHATADRTYIAGSFSLVNGASRSWIAAVSPGNGIATQ